MPEHSSLTLLLLRGGTLLAFALSGVLYAQLLIPNARQAAARIAGAAATLGWMLQSWLIASQWSMTGRPPLGNLAEAMVVLSWIVVLTFLVLLAGFREPVLGAFMMPLGVLLYSAGVTGRQATPPPGADFYNPLFQVHVTAFLIAYAAFSVAFCVGVMYLLLAREIRRKKLSQFFLQLPSLESLDTIGLRAVWAGFPLLVIGLVTGVVWGAHGANQWGLGQAKVLAAFVTLIIYVYYLVRRVVFRWSGRHCAMIAVVGYVLSLLLLMGGSMLGRYGMHL